MNKRIHLFLLFFSALCVACGTYLAVLPTLERKAVAEQQRELINIIADGEGKITVPTEVADEMDYYADEGFPEQEQISLLSGEVKEKNAIVLGTGILTIGSIDLKLPVAEGIRASDLKVALGHVPDTPAIGENGNSVIAGHRSYTYGDFLNRLDEVTIGDIMEYRDIYGMNHIFEVYEILIFEPGDPAVFDNTAYPSITLLTCTPVRVASHRLIVRGMLIEA